MIITGACVKPSQKPVADTNFIMPVRPFSSLHTMTLLHKEDDPGGQKPIRLAIAGLGLIGGSLGLALRKFAAGKAVITGWDCNPAVRESAIACGAVDYVADSLPDMASKADMVFLCTPVLQIISLIREITASIRPGTVISDVGSTKQYLQEKIVGILPPETYYVGGHPMAGREKSGITAARSDLFQNRWYIITPLTNTPGHVLRNVCAVVGWTGARVTVMDAKVHDQAAAVISHVPHIAAAALVNLLGAYPDSAGIARLAGGGFCDTTRIASSNPDMWADICLTNSDEILDGIGRLETILHQAGECIRKKNRNGLMEYFGIARERREVLLADKDVHPN